MHKLHSGSCIIGAKNIEDEAILQANELLVKYIDLSNGISKINFDL